MHPRAFQASLDHEFVGTFDHAGTNRPTLISEPWVLDQGFPFAQILHMLPDAFLLSKLWRKMSRHTLKHGGATMLKDMQAA